MLKGVIGLLKSYYIIRSNNDESVFSIHSLVQDVLRTRQKEEEDATLAKALKSFNEIKILDEITLEHALSIWNLSKKCPSLKMEMN